jgi:hypothetical protein
LSISAFVGAATFFALGHVDLKTTALMGVGVLLGAQLGARISLKTSAVSIRRILAGSLALVGVWMVFHALGFGR